MLTKNITNDDYMSIMVTHECNRNCPWCVDKYRGRMEYMSMSVLDKHLDAAKEAGCKDISILGGEPMMHPRIADICNRVKERGFNCILTTNGDNLGLLQYLSYIVDSINISWYNQEYLKYITADMFGCDVTISALIFKGRLDNINDLDSFIDTYESKGFHCKFRTLQEANDFCKKKKDQTHTFINSLEGERFTMYGSLNAIQYRDCIIGISDCLDESNFYHSLKGQVDGEISRSWVRQNVEKEKILEKEGQLNGKSST